MLKHNFDEHFTRKDWDSKKHNPQFCPKDTIPMWIADTDFKSPQPVIDALLERTKAGIFGYTVSSQELKTATSTWFESRFNWKFSPDCVMYSPGVVAGIISVLRACTFPGDNIITQAPCYTPFINITRDNGLHLLYNPMVLKDTRYEMDFEDLEQKLSHCRTRILILSNPQNPTGRVFSREEQEKIGTLCQKHNVFVISDEIHCDFIYPGQEHIPFGSLGSEYSQNSVTFINPSKTFNLAGFHTAAMITENAEIKSRIADIMTASKMLSENVLGSLAFATAYEQCAYYADQQIEYLNVSRQMNVDFFADIAEIDFINPEGTYLFWLDCRKMGLSQADLVAFFKEKAKLELSDGSSFSPYGIGFMRMNAACTHATLKEVFTRIKAAL